MVARRIQTPDVVAKSRLELPEQSFKCRLLATLTTTNQSW
jgi:hypothetical protein